MSPKRQKEEKKTKFDRNLGSEYIQMTLRISERRKKNSFEKWKLIWWKHIKLHIYYYRNNLQTLLHTFFFSSLLCISKFCKTVHAHLWSRFCCRFHHISYFFSSLSYKLFLFRYFHVNKFQHFLLTRFY